MPSARSTTLALLLILFACGDDTDAPAADAGDTDLGRPSLDAEVDGTVEVPDCTAASDCLAPPLPCATGACLMGRCAYSGPDADGDGHISASCPVSPPGGFPADDCDDADNTRYPGRPEVCDDRDDDCDPTSVGRRDADADGFDDYRCTNTDPALGETYNGPDCDDADPGIHPRAADGPTANCDTRDNDCDGMADEGCSCVGDVACGGSPDGMHDADPATCRRGLQRCVDGVLSTSCDGAVGPAAESCDLGRLDEDCDGESNEPEVCECADTETRLCGPEGADFGPASICRRGTQTCSGGLWGVCMGAVTPSVEACDGLLDEDCDGTVDEGCTCLDGETRACGEGAVGGASACVRGTQSCVGGVWGACVGAIGPSPEVCNSTDDDCDLVLNEEPEAGASCAAPRAATRCNAGSCEVTSCEPGYGNCDGLLSSGCETDLRVATLHCGACGAPCDAGEACVDGVCDPVLDVRTGSGHACVLRQSGRVMCWGANSFGQLGDGTTATRLRPVYVAGLNDAVGLAVANFASCVRRSSGRVACWGMNAAPTPTDVPLLDDVTLVSGGGLTFCAIRSDRSAWCWGDNEFGQLGDGTMGPARTTPAPVVGLGSAYALALGELHVCALTGVTHCWGSDQFGALGTTMLPPGATSSATPVRGGSSGFELTAGGYKTCTLIGGAPDCWGVDESMESSPSAGPSDFVQLALTGNAGCALRAGGEVQCWGGSVALGDGTSSPRALPGPIAGPTDFRRIGGGTLSVRVCAIRESSEVYCWGDSYLGNGVNTPSGVPVRVLDLP